MKSKKELLWHGITAIIVLAIFFGYSIYTQSVTNRNMLLLSQQVSSVDQKLDQAKKDLEDNDAMIQQNLNSQIDIVAENLDEAKKQNLEQIQTLSGELEESKQQISGLEDKLKNIKVSSADFSSIIKDVVKSVVTVKTNKGEGSGFIVDEEGYFVTNYHVIQGATNAAAFTYDDNLYAVKLVGYEPAIDIAILKMVTSRSFDALEFGNSNDVDAGERVIAVGNPAGFDFSVTEGIVSATGRKASNGVEYIQTDVPINPGNSGGPLINSGGEVIGINTIKIMGLEGIGFAIAANEVDDIVENAVRDDKG